MSAPSGAGATGAGLPARSRRGSATAWPWLFWGLWGGLLAALDLRSTEVLPAAVGLLVGGAVLGALRPRAWWAWALALAAWIPAGEPLLRLVITAAEPYRFNPGIILIPPIPALLGAGAGAAVRRAASD